MPGPRVYFECSICSYGCSAAYEENLYSRIDKHEDENPGHRMKLVHEEKDERW